MQRGGQIAEKNKILQKSQTRRNFEKVDFISVFTIYSAMSHLGVTAKIESMPFAARLQKRTENASPRTQKNVKIW